MSQEVVPSVTGSSKWTIENETITSGGGDVAHNADGSKTITLAASGYISGIGMSFNISADCILPKIPRYATCTQSSTSKTETSINMKWTSDSTCDYAWYSINNGSSWTAIGSINASSGTYTIPNLTANTSYNIKTRIRRKDSQLTTDSSVLNISTYDYPKVSNAPSFLIGNNPTIGIYNPLARSCKIYFIGNNNTQKEIGTITTESISGIDTEIWKTWLYNSIPNSKTGNYQIRIVVESLSRDNNYTGSSYSIRDDGSELPNFNESNWSYIANLTSLTNNNQAVINGNSQITFTVNTQATSSFGATITGYIYKWGSKSSSNSSLTGGEGAILEVDAVDSRGLIKPTTKTLVSGTTYIPYTKPTLDYSSSYTHRTDGISTEVRITLRGNLSVVKFGESGINNRVYECKYRVYNYSTNTWTGPYTIPANNFTLTENGVYRLSNQLIHANGSSGGFTTGIRYGIEIILKDGNGLLATLTTSSLIQITDGKIAKDVFQDGNGDYHQGINGLADDDYTEKIYGDLDIHGDLYINEELFVQKLEELISSAESPIGTIIPFPETNIPSGYMLCDGRAISREDYSELFDLIGTTYGDGDGSTTFNLPNLKGKVLVGLDNNDNDFNTIGRTGGEKTHRHASGDLYANIGSPLANANALGFSATGWHGTNSTYSVGNTSSATANGHPKRSHDTSVGGTTAYSSSLQPYIVINYIIKVARGMATVPDSVIVTNADVLQINQNKNDITSLTSKVEGIERYSSNEVIVGKWINNENIYRKVINLGSLPNNSTKKVVSNISSNLRMVTRIYGMATSGDYNIPLPDVVPNSQGFNIRIAYEKSSDSIVITTTSDRSTYSAYGIIEYIKTS